MRRYMSIILIISIIPLLLSACLFSADRNNPNDYKNVKKGWNPVVTISPTGGSYGSAATPGVGMSKNGEAVAVWTQHVTNIDRYGTFINKVNLPESRSWKGSIQIGGTANSGCQMPQVAVNGNGDATIAWLEYNDGTAVNDIWVKACKSGEWGDNSWVNQPTSGGPILNTTDIISNLRVSKNDSMYSAMVTWFQNGGVTSVYSWVKFKDIEDFIGPDAIPCTSMLSLPALGNEWASTMVAYNDPSVGPYWKLQSYKLMSGNTAADWNPVNLYVANTASDDNLKPIDFEQDYSMSGKSITVYCLPGDNTIYAVTSNDAYTTVHDPAGWEVGYMPRVALSKYGNCGNAAIVHRDPSDNLFAKWITLNPDMSIAEQAGVQFSDQSLGACGGHDVAMDAYGGAIIIWIQSGRLWARYHGQDGEERTDTIDGGGTVNYDFSDPNLFRPRVAMDENGNAVVVWVEDSQVKSRVYLK